VDLTKKVCLVTGAGGVLGRAFCARFASTYAIAGVYHADQAGAGAVEEYFDPLDPSAAPPEPPQPAPERGDGVFALYADLTDAADLERIVDDVLARYGRIDVLINGAARMLHAELLDAERFVPELRAQLDVNAVAPLALATLIARRFWSARAAENAQHNRCLVNVSSVSSLRLHPGVPLAAYAASKAALNQLTGYLADAFGAFSVRANALAPNTFPGVVAVEDVVEELGRLAEDDRNGELVVLG